MNTPWIWIKFTTLILYVVTDGGSTVPLLKSTETVANGVLLKTTETVANGIVIEEKKNEQMQQKQQDATRETVNLT